STFAVGTGTTLSLPAGGSYLADGSTVTLGGTGALNTTGQTFQLPTSGQAATVVLPALSPGLSLVLPGGNFSGGTTFDLPGGTGLILQGGSYQGGVTFNLGPGATADLTGGQTVTYQGTLAATGAGTVHLGGGTVATGAGGVTLNCAPGVFQWTAGTLDTTGGDVVVLQPVTLAGGADKVVTGGHTLDVFGGITQTGGSRDLRSGNAGTTTLRIETGGSYVIGDNSGINNIGGPTAMVVAGVVRKTAGAGTSSINVNG